MDIGKNYLVDLIHMPVASVPKRYFFLSYTSIGYICLKHLLIIHEQNTKEITTIAVVSF